MLACTSGGPDGAETDAAETADTSSGDGDGDGDNPGDGDGDGDGDALRPNWHQDVAPLVTEACQGCHTDGGIAPFAMQDYAQTAPWSAIMADQAEQGLMPPWHALETAQCQPPMPYKHDARLTDAQIQLLRDWADVGSPEGDPADAAPLPSPPNLDLANPTTTVTMGSPVSIDAQGNTLDFFHCLSLDPGNPEDVYLDGIQLIPGNREIVHHVLIYVDEAAASASWPGGVLQNCGGGSGVSGQLISAWVPGGLPMEPPAGVGISLPAGSRLVLNVHYHATGGGPTPDDGTGLALRWSTDKPEYGSIFTLLGAPGAGTSLTGPFSIPAGASDHVEEYEWVVSSNGNAFPDSVEARIWAVANHMHLVGVDMRAWIEDRDTGEQTCLVHTPNWDFNWQRIYEYDAPANQGVRVKAGDIVRVRCAYDNSMNNPALVNALAEVGLDTPIEVNLGEGTLDEMCLTAVGVGIKGL
ncbi:monooxygenase [Enhygromyxa salina]|uniref:Copper type II ascorbate-dependent monooxygenase C-terminal domain-containing protein n=1 Tax=Enhygromyxa salina TaxID=215803 RepID=A0A2S9XPJ6_9BACT|nr:hypothetical protein [Enhygromyxa salina]PRP94775.1 hypothetical protein ENSA7_75980 [Enhygromyxa salina]